MKKCFTLLLIALFGSFTFHDPESGILITNIKVVDTEKGEVRKNPKNIWIKGDSIWRVDNYKVPVSQDKNVIVIDGTGKYIIPGLWDMHAHPDDPEMWRMNPDNESRDLLLPLFVLHGVTGIRDMAGSMEVIRGWKKKIGQKTLLGPEIYACGPLIDGPNPMWDGSVGIANLARVKPVVDSLMNSGSDFLKVYSLLPDSTYFALSSYAKKLKIPFAGHVPLDVSTTSASDTGMKSQEHLLNLLIDCSSMADKIYDGSMDYEGITDPIAKYIYRNDLMLKTFNKRRAYEIFKVFVKNNTWHTPTISMWHSNAYFEENIKKDSAYFNYLPPYMRRYWDPGVNDHLQERYADILAVKKRLVKKYMEVIGEMNKAGVKLLAGTDMGANPLCFPGISLHRELELLVHSGLSPAEALKTATLHPAIYLGIENDYGSVGEGKMADVVLLAANPLDDIKNTQKIFGVIRKGQFLDKNDIRQELIEISTLQTR